MTTPKNTTPATADELRAALATIEEQERAEQARQAALIQQARTARAQKIYDDAPDLDAELSQSGDAHYQAATAAATTGDLNGAYAGFVGYLGSRTARARARVEMQNAANALGVNPHTAAELAHLRLSFSDFIDTNLPSAVEAYADAAIAAHIEAAEQA